jgi:hypothetical protein
MSVIKEFLNGDVLLNENVTEINFKDFIVILQYNKMTEKKAMNKVKRHITSKYDRICRIISKKLKPIAQKWQKEYGIEFNMSREKFIEKLKLVMIDIKKDGTMVLVFDTGDMFGDRNIEIVLSKRGRLEVVDLNDPEDD